MKSVVKFGLSAVMVATLAACSGAETRRQASDDFEYLNAPSPSEWNTLPGQKPEFTGAYAIPQSNFEGAVGSNVDIRPPQQILELIPGARYEHVGSTVTIWVPRAEQLQRVWDTVQGMAKEGAFPVKTSSAEGIETGWVDWVINEDDDAIESRYLLTPTESRGRHGLRITLLEARRSDTGTVLPEVAGQRYATQMTNLIATSYDAEIREEARIRAQELVKNIPISLGKDRSGLPVIVARAPYDVFWERLPSILTELGFKVEDRNRSQGTLEVDYNNPDEMLWDKIGTERLDLAQRTYNIQLGDLGNRTSINFTDKNGKPVKEETLAQLSDVLAAVIDYMNTK
ncbi:outer membrane protein assembly factor BamC [Enterovibrio nigricans]|uniref:Outer membrane protein assembly factor BamC n=1 Tax=Enterovibrio nigricans DSM 22720 TaxID=1121868 RepID=A0A1T4UNE0_9GAMM|nr:outer membrane protein assembly factor BamC [Enterovibrio nigricans]PKF50623.1 outer membrane protein assembly factor BamC [Enterovibrio nigricans]SKA54219.1 outer membrane protein assembly factor BamC [Enterovibrio nigricans DSM 22720]